MNLKDSQELAEYEARLRGRELLWQAQYQRVLHSDRAAIDIGVAALKNATLINAGAVVALLAFVGQLWDANDSKTAETLLPLLKGATPFVVGLVCAVCAGAIAYFYQSFVTVRAQHGLLEVSEGSDKLKPQKVVPPLTGLTGILMIALVIAAYDRLRSLSSVAGTSPRSVSFWPR